jgi:hypothetical protein
MAMEPFTVHSKCGIFLKGVGVNQPLRHTHVTLHKSTIAFFFVQYGVSLHIDVREHFTTVLLVHPTLEKSNLVHNSNGHDQLLRAVHTKTCSMLLWETTRVKYFAKS